METARPRVRPRIPLKRGGAVAVLGAVAVPLLAVLGTGAVILLRYDPLAAANSAGCCGPIAPTTPR